MKLQDTVVVLTGAGSGIGRALAVALANRGCHLALADINVESLKATADLLRNAGGRVTLHALDVADRQAVAALPSEVIQAHGKVNVIINNAGVAIGGTFEQVSEADFDWLMRINFDSVVCMTRAFLPLLHQVPEARIVNISSLFGLIAPPGQAAYCASKFAVRGFSNALRHELEGTHIGVTVVHPGGVNTSIAQNAKAPAGADPEEEERNRREIQKLLRLPPERAAEIIIAGIERNRGRVLVGSDAKLLSLIERLMPANYWKLLGRLVRK
jgi:short-subunit dehydrogenase